MQHPKLRSIFSFSSILSLKGNKKRFIENIEKVRHDFQDISFTNKLAKKNSKLRKKLVPFCLLKVAGSILHTIFISKTGILTKQKI